MSGAVQYSDSQRLEGSISGPDSQRAATLVDSGTRNLTSICRSALHHQQPRPSARAQCMHAVHIDLVGSQRSSSCRCPLPVLLLRLYTSRLHILNFSWRTTSRLTHACIYMPKVCSFAKRYDAWIDVIMTKEMKVPSTCICERGGYDQVDTFETTVCMVCTKGHLPYPYDIHNYLLLCNDLSKYTHKSDHSGLKDYSVSMLGWAVCVLVHPPIHTCYLLHWLALLRHINVGHKLSLFFYFIFITIYHACEIIFLYNCLWYNLATNW